MDVEALRATAKAMVAPGKGILAADESSGTIKKRFDTIDVESTEENRRAYRDLLFTTAGVEQYISGVILFDETIRQSSADGTPFPKLLASSGIIPGIKVDTGAKQLAMAEKGETVTEGLDGLRERLAEYHELGARFAKWRATYTITDALPSQLRVRRQRPRARSLRRACARRPTSSRSSSPRCSWRATTPSSAPSSSPPPRSTPLYDAALRAARPPRRHAAEAEHGAVGLRREAAGRRHRDRATSPLACFRRCVPAAVPGIVFLSGGQTDEQATARLNEMNKLGPHPWELSFSYGRALQAPTLKAWKGKPSNVGAAQAAFAHRAKMNSAARSGSYDAKMENAA